MQIKIFRVKGIYWDKIAGINMRNTHDIYFS